MTDAARTLAGVADLLELPVGVLFGDDAR